LRHPQVDELFIVDEDGKYHALFLDPHWFTGDRNGRDHCQLWLRI